MLDSDIGFGWVTPIEIRFRALTHLVGSVFERTPVKAVDLDETRAAPVDYSSLELSLSRQIRAATNRMVSTLYDSAARRQAQYCVGNTPAILAVVSGLNIVDESRLTWEQVVEFRRDSQARSAFRHFVHWLDHELVDKPIEYISDEVSARLERYEWAVTKHGLSLVVGTLSTTLNPQSLISASTVGVAMEAIANKPMWSLLAGGGLLVGRAALSIATALVDRTDLQMANREIAYVHELKTRFDKK